MLRYEVGFGVEFREAGGKFIHNFDSALELLEHKIAVILDMVEATLPPTLYLTQDSATASRHKEEYTPNFRDSIAITKPYKGNRPTEKPFHYHNLTEYMLSKYDCVMCRGLEADDVISIEQNKEHEYETIICSRDKDLRITPGWHFSWECGKSRSYGPHLVEPLGELQEPEKSKMFGTGLKFFYSQMLMGDPTDNSPGIPNKGCVAAYELLKDAESEEELFGKVSEVYKEYAGESWKAYFKEQADLLWMIQELDQDNNPIRYKLLDER